MHVPVRIGPAETTLIDQLKIGGIMVLPVETSPGRQELQRITRTEDSYERRSLLPVRFVPLVPGLPKDEFITRVRNAIEEASSRLAEAGRREQAQLGRKPSSVPTGGQG